MSDKKPVANCPNCGAPLNGDKNAEGECVCEYCGTRIIFPKKEDDAGVVATVNLNISSGTSSQRERPSIWEILDNKSFWFLLWIVIGFSIAFASC